MHCKDTYKYWHTQVFSTMKTCCWTLFYVIQHYTKIIALFFGNFEEFLYLCTIKQVSLKIQPHATKPMFHSRSYGACDPLLPLHPAADRLAEAPFSARRRAGSGAPHEIETSHVSPRRSKHYLPTPRAALTALFSCFSDPQSFKPANSNFQALKLRLLSLQTPGFKTAKFRHWLHL